MRIASQLLGTGEGAQICAPTTEMFRILTAIAPSGVMSVPVIRTRERDTARSGLIAADATRPSSTDAACEEASNSRLVSADPGGVSHWDMLGGPGEADVRFRARCGHLKRVTSSRGMIHVLNNPSKVFE